MADSKPVLGGGGGPILSLVSDNLHVQTDQYGLFTNGHINCTSFSVLSKEKTITAMEFFSMSRLM